MVVGGGDGAETNGKSVDRLNISKKSTKSKSQTKSRYLRNNNNWGEYRFLTSRAREAFDYLRQTFTQAPNLWHFNPKCHIQIKTDASGYVIERVLSQLTPNQLTLNEIIKLSIDWRPVAYFSRKMIPIKTCYKTHNGKLIAIVEAFKIWRH